MVLYNRTAIYLIMAFTFLGAILISFSGFTSALSVGGSRDCDANAIIHCGALSTSELQQKYNDSEDVRRIFSHFGLRQSHMEAIDEKAVAGYVHSNNTVTVNGKVVATDVVTLGRQNMEGSTAVSYKNGTFYKRPPSVSFASSSLPAFVVMNNGNFGYAVIASCGNPVIERPDKKPVAQPVKEAQPKKETKAPAPSAKAQATAVSSANVTNVYHEAPKPAPSQPVHQVPAPAAQPVAAAPQPEKAQPQRELPKTGASGALGLAGAAGVISSIGHFIYKRRFS